MNEILSRTTLVAPRVGAWIETINHNGLYALEWSPLAWGRGLKRCTRWGHLQGRRSPLAWGRGLKLVLVPVLLLLFVAPRVGAWIETKH